MAPTPVIAVDKVRKQYYKFSEVVFTHCKNNSYEKPQIAKCNQHALLGRRDTVRTPCVDRPNSMSSETYHRLFLRNLVNFLGSKKNNG